MDEMQNKELFIKPAVAGSLAELQLRIYCDGGGRQIELYNAYLS